MTVPDPDPPAWFAPLARVARTARADDISLFVPPPGHHRRSAVLLLFGEGPAGPDVLLTERAAGLRAHPGQVAFPGGRLEPSDAGPGAAAVREAQEETGLDAAGVVVLATLPDLYRQLGLDGFFEAFVLSAELGCTKPDPRMYRAGSEALGLQPQECLFVDDDPGLVEAARALGYQAVTIHRGAGHPPATPFVTSLSDLLLLVDA